MTIDTFTLLCVCYVYINYYYISILFIDYVQRSSSSLYRRLRCINNVLITLHYIIMLKITYKS